jgi:hypothetical protein
MNLVRQTFIFIQKKIHCAITIKERKRKVDQCNWIADN